VETVRALQLGGGRAKLTGCARAHTLLVQVAGSKWKSALVGAIVMVTVLASVAGVAAATNLISNGTFEGTGSGSLSGWAGSGGTLSLVAGSGGGHAARVAASNAGSQAYAYTVSKPVQTTTAGTAYTLDGAVRSSTGGTVCLKAKEVPSGGSTTVGSAQRCVAATTAWQSFPTVAYTTLKSGDSLTVNVVEASPAAGATFDIDNLVLAVGSPGSDGTAPSIPGNVTATANSATAVTVGWAASTDNVGVTGYDVYRDGAKMQTVAGSVTSWKDTSVAASTTYTYAVDAFDAAGNTSQLSPGAAVTTPAGGGGGGSNPCGTVPTSSTPYSHIVVIMDENLTVPDWQAATNAPYTHMLATDCRLETNAAGETHPSFPNYLAVTSGTFNTCLGCSSTADNIFHQLDVAGKTWKDYNQSMPHNCATNTSSVPYYRDGHNPAFWFTDLGATSKGGDGSCATRDVPADPNLWNDISADALPNFAWIAPDDCRDMHWMNGPCETVTGQTKANRIPIGDAYIGQIVTAIAATPSYRAGQTLIVVTWDESNEDSTQVKGNWGIDCSNPTVYAAKKASCQVVTILVSARITAGPTNVFYSHYSLTSAFESNFGLPLLGAAPTVTPAPIT
jgi:phosphatidylinositol-3-phosphatase